MLKKGKIALQFEFRMKLAEKFFCVFLILIFVSQTSQREIKVKCEEVNEECTYSFHSYGFEVLLQYDNNKNEITSQNQLEIIEKYQNNYLLFTSFRIIFKRSGNLILTQLRTNQQINIKFAKLNNEITFKTTSHSSNIIFFLQKQTKQLYIIEKISSSQANNWMELLGSQNATKGSLGSLTLAEIALPGTHDSGTFSLTLQTVEPPDSFVLIMNDVCAILNNHNIPLNCSDADKIAEFLSYPWSVTQKVNWKNQMESGCRSFDYRAYQRGSNDWVIQHSLTGSNFTSPQELSSAVVNFLEKNPGELIIIEYTIYDSGNETELINLFLTGLGKYGYHWVEGTTIPGNPLISQMIANNQRAILVSENFGQQENVSVGISNDYPDSCNNQFINNYDGNAIQNFAKETANAMRKIAWQITPGAECISLGILGSLIKDNSLCMNSFGFNCSIDLMGYINQLNPEFNINYVFDEYSQVKPIDQAFYFGNLWNFDHPDWSFIQNIPSLDIVLLSNQLKSFSENIGKKSFLN